MAAATSSAELWAGVDRLIDSTASLDDLAAHRLHLLALHRRREQGAPVPPELAASGRAAAAATLLVPHVLRRVREAYDGPILLMKGAAVATYYPDPALRPFRDLDILVDDATRAQRSLIEAGFEPVGEDGDDYFARLHHLRPVMHPALPLLIEVHRRPEWPKWCSPPRKDALLASGVDGTLGVRGIMVPPPAEHALLLAGHSWSTAPLRRLLDLVDVAALTDGLPREEVDALAAEWGVEGLWSMVARAVDVILLGRDDALPRWARNVTAVRERTVLENHVARIVSPFSIFPAGRACTMAARALAEELRPADGETRRAKSGRALRALPNALAAVSDHDAEARR
jgi:hypothetical protein